MGGAERARTRARARARERGKEELICCRWVS